jgi:hypothetical protein
MPKAQYKSVKVPAWAYANAKRVLDDLVRGGTDRIPTALRTPAIEEALQQGPTLNAVLALAVESFRQAISEIKPVRRKNRRASSRRSQSVAERRNHRSG